MRRGIIPGKTRLVMVESPTNPRMQICDIRAIAAMARAAGAICCVDNSIMAVQQRPIDLGADISMVSGTKFIGGHGDVTLGILAVKGVELAKRVYFLQVRWCGNLFGGAGWLPAGSKRRGRDNVWASRRSGCLPRLLKRLRTWL